MLDRSICSLPFCTHALGVLSQGVNGKQQHAGDKSLKVAKLRPLTDGARHADLRAQARLASCHGRGCRQGVCCRRDLPHPAALLHRLRRR